MRSTQPLNLVFLSLVAFAVSVGFAWPILRNLRTAIFVGIVAGGVSYGTTAIALKQRIRGDRQKKHSLRIQIQQLEREETQLYHSLYEATATQEQLEASISALQGECHQLLNRVSELHAQRNSLYQEISNFQQQKQQKQQEFVAQSQQNKLLEKAKTEIAHSLEISKTQFQQLKKQILKLREELEKIQVELSEKQNQKEEAGKISQKLNQQKSYLEQGIQSLQQRKTELIRQKESNQTSQISIDVPLAWLEWLEFSRQLTPDERKVFRAILDRDEAALKQIADEKTTMPEVLIESLNENALQTIGDTIFTSNTTSLIPDLHPEYLPILLEPIQFEFKDFLSQAEQSPQTEESNRKRPLKN